MDKGLLTSLSFIFLSVLVIPANGIDTISVSGTPWGVSSELFGACEGSTNFNINDLTDLGINNYRVWGSMARWEWEDDDGVYGSPTIAEIKANPDVINWAWWDNAINNPPGGSAYHWSGDPGVKWQGTDIELFQSLKNNGIAPVVTLRPVDNYDGPAWAHQLNPPTTAEDWNEWWEHVFATVYWFNVRNNYQVDYWQVHNEPDNPNQGWGGTLEDYYLFIQYTYDAIQYVYNTYLPGRQFYVNAPVGRSTGWTDDCLINVGDYFNVVDFHRYLWAGTGDWTTEVREVHGYIDQYGGGKDYLICISEWGSYLANDYDGVKFTVQTVTKNCINGSRPGNDHVQMSQIFSLYDWGDYLSGLIHGDAANPVYTPGYYGLRLALRGVQGGRTTYETTSSNRYMDAITTKDAEGNIYLLVNNTGPKSATVDADLSALITSGTGTMWEFSSANMDAVVGSPTLDSGHVVFDIPKIAAVLLKFAGGPPDTDPPTPDPMTWATVPYATGSSSIAMVATTATDASGVEYYFSCISGGGHDSGWQAGTSYEDTGLQSATQYCYTVKARDKSTNLNQTAESTVECATTESGCTASTMHVESIVCGTVSGSPPNKYGQVTVTIYDKCGNAVSGADVTGTFTGDFNETLTETTDGTGVAVITTTAQAKKPSYTFCVDGVTHATLTYAPGDNVETCDSN